MFVGQYQPLLHLWYPQLPKALRQVIPRLDWWLEPAREETPRIGLDESLKQLASQFEAIAPEEDKPLLVPVYSPRTERLSRIGRDAGAYHDARDDGGGYAPPECAFQSHSMSSSGLFVIREPVFLVANLPKNQEDVNKTCANGGVFGVNNKKALPSGEGHSLSYSE